MADKEPFSTQVDKDIVAAVRATVRGLQYKLGPEVTLSGFVTDALAAHVAEAEADHNDGKPWDVHGALTRGPRITNSRKAG